MPRNVSHITILVLCLLVLAFPAGAERRVIDLSTADWSLWRDKAAEWIDDDLFTPPVDVAALPVNPPSCGWDALADSTEIVVHLPATVEQYFWGDNGNWEGVAGDYRGVSWWTTTVDVPEIMSGQRIYLDFDSVHLRAEIFVNRTLTGYDLIGGTPFSVDVTAAIRPGESNHIAVRITDPLGNFNWNDRPTMRWGQHDVPAAHGFGGITGNVHLRAVDAVFVEDVFVRNMPDITTVNVEATVHNLNPDRVSGTLSLVVRDAVDFDTIIYQTPRNFTAPPGDSTFVYTVKAPKAVKWDLDNPHLYNAEVTFTSTDKVVTDTARQRFGFRWFGIGEEDGDQRLYLNGRRIVLRGAMTWGFWPDNGVFATPEMARRDVAVAKELGLTYMNYHRAIGQPGALDASDEMGLLTYEEPGGYSNEGADPGQPLWQEWRRIKLIRMVRRDRSRPSLIIYNLQNRTPNPLYEEDLANMRAAHALDPSRILTFISGFWAEPPEIAPEKLFFKPYDMTEYYTGWYDMHNAAGMNSYADRLYNGPTDYFRYSGNTAEVVFWGEDGNIYSPPRLQLIRDYYTSAQEPQGWQAQRFVEWHDAYARFLDESGWRAFFPDVDSFTRSMGNTTLYYHGRIIENVRIGNTGDAYTINGWAAPHNVNQSEVADLYRNPVGDTGLMARYCRPLYVSVKLRNKLVQTGATLVADIWLVNEEDISGHHSVTITLSHESGARDFQKIVPVNIEGDETYGQLLVEGLEIPLDDAAGYFTVRAELRDRRGRVVTDGSDEAFTVSLDFTSLSTQGAVADTSGAINRALSALWGFTLPALDNSIAAPDYIIVGANGGRGSVSNADILQHVANGATAIVLADPDRFASTLAADDTQALAYSGSYAIGAGKLIAGRHPLLDGLPQAQACGWEYQAFNATGRGPIALLASQTETVIAGVSGNRLDVGDVLSLVPYGRGRIVLSGLPMMQWLESDDPAGVTAKRILGNMVVFGGK